MLKILLITIFTIALAFISPTASAEQLPMVYPGQTLLFSDGGYSEHRCTLGAVGRDSANRLVGITAGHCSNNRGESVLLPNAAGNAPDINYGPVGTFALVVGGPGVQIDMDYAVIVYDESKVQGTVQGPNVRVDSVTNPYVGQRVCKDGSTTRLTCGVVRSTRYMTNTGYRFDTSARNQPGDSGGPLVAGSSIVGITDAVPCIYYIFGCWPTGENISTRFTAIMADMNMRGGVGAGFTPAP